MPMTFNQLLMRAIRRQNPPAGYRKMACNSPTRKMARTEACFQYRGKKYALSLEVSSRVPRDHTATYEPEMTVYDTPSRLSGEVLPISKVPRILPDFDPSDEDFRSLVSVMEEATSWTEEEARSAIEYNNRRIGDVYHAMGFSGGV